MICSKKHELIRAAYLFYYASEAAFCQSPDMRKKLKVRLNALINDALILAKKVCFLLPVLCQFLTHYLKNSLNLMFSMPSLFLTTLSSYKNKNSVLETGSCIITCLTGEPRTLRVVWMRGTRSTRTTAVILELLCYDRYYLPETVDSLCVVFLLYPLL